MGIAELVAALALFVPSPISCESQISFPEPFRADGRTIMLGVVALPQTYRPQVVATGSRPWPYWSKAGLAIRGGSPPVIVSVAKAWRNRVRIEWGDGGGSAVRFESCPASGSNKWNAYSGGFHLRSPSACVPLIFRVGNRSATVRLGLARRCG